jgi:hypothetical protein
MHVKHVTALSMTVIASVMLNTGCSTKQTVSPTTTTTSSAHTTIPTSTQDSSGAAAGQDYGKLLITDTDVSPPGAPKFTAAEPTLNPLGKPGVATSFTSADGSDVIGDTILILPDAQSATGVLQASIQSMGQSVTGGTPTSSTVGTGSVMQSGTSPDGTKSVTVLLFTEGTASVTLEFEGLPEDPVTPDYVTMVGQRQDDAIKTGLHS